MSGRSADRPRRGRPRRATAREVEVIALRLFAERGYDAVTVEDLAAEAEIGRRTFHRYFSTKADVLWHDFDTEVDELAAALAARPADEPLWRAVRTAVLEVNRHLPEHQPELRNRMDLIVNVPQVRAAAADRYDAWERTVTDFVRSRRPGTGELYPLAAGRATLAVCRTAFEAWLHRPEAELTDLLAEAIDLLAAGFPEPTTHPLSAPTDH